MSRRTTPSTDAPPVSPCVRTSSRLYTVGLTVIVITRPTLPGVSAAGTTLTSTFDWERSRFGSSLPVFISSAISLPRSQPHHDAQQQRGEPASLDNKSYHAFLLPRPPAERH